MKRSPSQTIVNEAVPLPNVSHIYLKLLVEDENKMQWNVILNFHFMNSYQHSVNDSSEFRLSH